MAGKKEELAHRNNLLTLKKERGENVTNMGGERRYHITNNVRALQMRA